MKKYFKIFALAVVLAGVGFAAQAKWNIRQNDDGTTDWVKEGTDRALVVAPVGRVVLNVRIADVSSAATVAVAVPATDMRISLVQTVLHGQITGTDAKIRIWTLDTGESDTSGNADEVTNGTSQMTITACTDPNCSEGAGTVDSFTPNSTNSNNFVEKNQSILVHTNGGSTNAAIGTITITLEPR